MNARSTLVGTVTAGALGLLMACSHLRDSAPPPTSSHPTPPPKHTPIALIPDEHHLVQSSLVRPGDSAVSALSIPPAAPSAPAGPTYGLVIPPQDGGRAVIIEIPPPPDFASTMPVVPPRR